MLKAYADIREYAFSTWTLEDLSLNEALQTIADNGFVSVELWADTVHYDPRVALDRAQVNAWLKALNLSVHSVHAPFRNYRDAPRDEAAFRALRTRYMRALLEDMSDAQMPIMVVHALDRNEYNYTADQVNIVHDFLGELNAYARKLGVQVAVENLAPGRGAGEMCTTLQNQVALYRDLPLKYCLDIGHAPLCGVELIDEALAAGKDLVTLHIHNNDGVHDLHDVPSDGVIDWPALYERLRAMGYNGQFVMEIAGGRDPRAVVRRTAQLFER
ncbi:MAG: sugar phosphate isomerase/epimerase [Clostridia bacterium]